MLNLTNQRGLLNFKMWKELVGLNLARAPIGNHRNLDSMMGMFTTTMSTFQKD